MPVASGYLFLVARRRWAAGIALAACLVMSSSCKRRRFPSRGDAAAVVVVVPHRDAAGPPNAAEQEPNDSTDRAQLLAMDESTPAARVDAVLAVSADGKAKDVDTFKLVVPGERQPAEGETSAKDGGGPPVDPRSRARLLSVEVSTKQCTGLVLQFLDEAGKVLEGASMRGEGGGGMPNLAVLPGETYFLRVRPLAKVGRAKKAAKTSEMKPTDCAYRLTAQLGRFEVADEREPNGAMDTAISLSVVGTIERAGYHGWLRDQDFYRLPLPDVASSLDLELEAVEGVGASLHVLDASGGRLASARGRRGERLGLHNVILQPARPADPPSAGFAFVVVRTETGQNRERRYVLRLTLGPPKRDSEVEPNDRPENATQVKDGTYSGYLPSGDVDFYRYVGEGQQDVRFEVSFPSRVRGKVEAFRPGGLPAGAVEIRKPHKTIALPKVPTMGQALLLRVSALRGDGNPNDPYSLTISSSASAPASPPVPSP